MRSFIGILVLANTIYMGYSLCNTCSKLTGLACVENTSFKLCSGGLPIPPAFPCPNGTVCSTSSPQICIPNNGNVEPECSGCGNCNDQSTFACTTYNTFKLCLGSKKPSSENYMCPWGLMCNMDSPNICEPQDSGIGSTCPWKTLTNTTVAPPPTIPTVTTTTTVSPVTSPQEFCTAKGRGRYEISSDPTCSEFISCSQSGGVWTGSIYVCPNNRYFNPNTQVCGGDKPDRCKPTPEPEPQPNPEPEPEPTEQPNEICD